MMRKKLVVDRFDLLTKQQIKNHNDALLAHNISMELLREGLDSVRQKQAADKAIINNNIVEIREKMDEYFNFSVASYREFSSKLSDITYCLNDLKKSDCDSKKQLEKTDRQISKLNQVENPIREEMCKLSKRVDDLQKELSRFVSSVSSNMKVMIESLRYDLSTRPCAFAELERNVQNEIRSCATDVRGVHENIENLRQSLYYDQKKIEDLYNKFNRLKDSIQQK